MKEEKPKIEDLVTKHLESVYRLVFRLTGRAEEAEDITQEVFVKVWKNLARYDSDKN